MIVMGNRQYIAVLSLTVVVRQVHLKSCGRRVVTKIHNVFHIVCMNFKCPFDRRQCEPL